MNSYLYSIYDVKAKYFMPPVLLRTDMEAIRLFDDMLVDQSHPVGRHPEDYSLYKIACIDMSTGVIIPEREELKKGEVLYSV